MIITNSKITTQYCKLVELMIITLYNEFEGYIYSNLKRVTNVDFVKNQMDDIAEKTVTAVCNTYMKRKKIEVLLQSNNTKAILHYCTMRDKSDQLELRSTTNSIVKQFGEYIKSNHVCGFDPDIVRLMLRDGYFVIIKTKMLGLLK